MYDILFLSGKTENFTKVKVKSGLFYSWLWITAFIEESHWEYG